jgi:hypothetical protein
MNPTIIYRSSFGRQIRTDVQAQPAYKNMAVKAGGTPELTTLTGNYKLSRTVGLIILYRTVKRDERMRCLYHPQMAINQKWHGIHTQQNQKHC